MDPDFARHKICAQFNLHLIDQLAGENVLDLRPEVYSNLFIDSYLKLEEEGIIGKLDSIGANMTAFLAAIETYEIEATRFAFKKRSFISGRVTRIK